MNPWTLYFYLSLLVSPSHGQLDDIRFRNGYTDFSLGSFAGKLTQASQNLVSLQSLRDSNFDFLPFDYLPNRTYDGAHHIGDVTFRYRRLHASSWTSVDSALDRNNITPIQSLHAASVIAAADMTPTLNDTAPPIQVTREWLDMGTMLGLRINITNDADSTVEIGSLGLPIAINNIFIGRSDVEVQRKCSFADPYIGLDAGYVQVTPVRGVGSALVILSLDRSPFEAWRFLFEPAGDLGYHVQTYEGNYEWQIHS